MEIIYLHCKKDFIEGVSTPKEVHIEESPNVPLFVHGGVNYWEANYRDVVVIPSYSFDPAELAKIVGITHYEERHLYNLILLRNAHTRIIYVTSMPIDAGVIEYYWKLLPGKVPFSSIRHRLILLSVHDSTPKPLSEKVLERPRLINRIKKAIRDTSSACLTVFNSSPFECKLAKVLGIPLLAANFELRWWGTKAGSKRIFQECGVLSPPGTIFSRDPKQLAHMIVELCEKFPESRRLMVKLNDGFSGEGNAILNMEPILTNLQCSPGGDSLSERISAVVQGLKTMKFQGKGENGESFIKKIEKFGAIAELFVEGAIGSPSVQAVVNTTGAVYVLSTHEQILGGEDQQIYTGCRFPASDEYRIQLQEIGMKVGKNLAEKGVIDHFGVDFVITKNPKTKEFIIYAIEINLRQGGTTHPMMTLKLLTDGMYDMETGHFLNRSGKQRFYIASDNLQSESYKGLLPHDIMEIFLQHDLHWNVETETGVVFHLLGALSEYGKIGVTCIGESPAHSQYIYDHTVKLLDQIAAECTALRADLWASDTCKTVSDIQEVLESTSCPLICHEHPALPSISPK